MKNNNKKKQIYTFTDSAGTFTVADPYRYPLYFPLTNRDGSLLSSISPNLAGDIKHDNDHFITIPASIEDVRSNLLCRREFFLSIGKNPIRLSSSSPAVLEAGFLYHKLTKRIHGLRVEILNFIPFDSAVEVMAVHVMNESASVKNIVPTSFIPLYGRGERNIRDHRHVTSLLNRITLSPFGIDLKPTMIFDEKGHTVNKTTYFVRGYQSGGAPLQGQFPTLDYFFGTGDVICPDAVRKPVKPTSVMSPEYNGKEVCAAFRFTERALKQGESVRYILLIGMEDDDKKIDRVCSCFNTPQKVSLSLESTKEYWRKRNESGLSFAFNDFQYDNWLLWVKLQPTLRKLFGCSFLPHFDYGKGGRGWRDLWQDALTLTLTEPEKAEQLIVSSFKGVRIDGSNATIITGEGDFISDRNRINRVWMDHGVWPYLTTRLYIHKTGDTGLLLKNVSYFQDHQFKRSKTSNPGAFSKDFLLREKNGQVYEGTILEHLLVQNLVQFFNVGKHNIVRLENADWNDGLDMASEQGESVTFSCMYAHNLKDLCVFLKKLKDTTAVVSLCEDISLLLDGTGTIPVDYSDYREKQKRLDAYLDKVCDFKGRRSDFLIEDLIRDLTRKSEHLSAWIRTHEWLHEGFFNGYYDNTSERVEGAKKKLTRMMLPSQVFAIMSGVAEERQIITAWNSIKKNLYDKSLKGFRLNTDFSSVYLDLGRAFGFSYGDKENGAFFN
ncbi:MAG: cellobiose phosphorylase, partial [Candidatus Omnitrophica bacterium]|nr:cellobiose phosphorylase [Candidatus Omnitrophota bacterium]